MNNEFCEKFGKLAFFYLVAYVLWRFVFTNTFLQNSFIIYGSFVFLLVAFSYLQFSTNKTLILPNKIALLWIPYASYTVIHFFLLGSFESFSYWIIFIFIVSLPHSFNVYNSIPFKLLLISGLFISGSIFFQFFFPSLFNSIYSSIFLESHKEAWEFSEYGLCGLTYQLGASSEMIFLGEMSLLFLWMKGNKNNILFAFLLIVTILAMSLTGKRTNTLLACASPVVVLLFAKEMNAKKIIITLILSSLLIVISFYFVSHISDFLSIPFTKRIAESYIKYLEGIDFDSGRRYLKHLARLGFEESPFWGIGAGRFPYWSKLGTEVHHIYYQLLCEQGLVGFILFIVPSMYCLCMNIFLMIHTEKKSFFYPYILFSFLFQLHFFVDGFTENVLSNLTGILIYPIVILLLNNINNSLFKYNGHKI